MGVGFPLGRIGGSPSDRFINREARVLYLAMSLSGALRWTFDVCGGALEGGLLCPLSKGNEHVDISASVP